MGSLEGEITPRGRKVAGNNPEITGCWGILFPYITAINRHCFSFPIFAGHSGVSWLSHCYFEFQFHVNKLSNFMLFGPLL